MISKTLWGALRTPWSKMQPEGSAFRLRTIDPTPLESMNARSDRSRVTGPPFAIAGAMAVSISGAVDISSSPLRKYVLGPSALIAKSVIVAPFVQGRRAASQACADGPGDRDSFSLDDTPFVWR